ncbi:allatostatin-A receptor-like [Diadema setosum]|uniref:allatostatin-A receptor-like n=1 Tax=Diadema setosum TaxID=31175 RepID=UPI003B3AA813
MNTELNSSQQENQREMYTTDFEVTELEQTMTWSWHPMQWSWYIIGELVTAILGIMGNLLVIVVIFCRRSKSRSTDILVGHLACADLLTSLFLVPYPELNTIPYTWFGALFCKVFKGNYLMWTSVTASIYILSAISIDRYFAVVYPLHFKRFISRRFVIAVVAMIWIGASVLMIPIILINNADVNPGKCIFHLPFPKLQVAFGLFTFIIRLAIPTIIMLFTQVTIARVLRREAARFKSQKTAQSLPSSFHDVARARVLELLLLVVVVYIVCWAPDQLAFLSFNLGLVPDSHFASPLHRILIVLAFCNSCANPIIYTFRHKKFRGAAKDLFKGVTASRSPIFEEFVSENSRITTPQGVAKHQNY